MRGWLVIVLIGVWPLGCGVGPIEREHQGRLEAGDSLHPQDDSFYDAYTFQAQQGYTIHLELESEDFDAFLLLNDPGGNQFEQNDDRDEDDRNARIETEAPTKGTYTVFANSRAEGESGAYTLRIRTSAAN